MGLLWAAVGLQYRLHVIARLLAWVSDTAKMLVHSPAGWLTEVAISPAAVQDLQWIVRNALRLNVCARRRVPMPTYFPTIVWSDACEEGGGVVRGFFHSHPDRGAYFSDEDLADALGGGGRLALEEHDGARR